MTETLPANLCLPESRLIITLSSDCKPNRTDRTIVISGTRSGFLSLTNAMLFYSNNLCEEIYIHKLPFVEASIELSIHCVDEKTQSTDGDVVEPALGKYCWRMTEDQIDGIAAQIHSLGYVNSEVHFDDNKTPNELSVYCVVN